MAAAGLLTALHVLYFFNQACDDGYISLGYARRWIEGRGLSLNDVAPSEGYSNFLWVVLLAGAMKVGIDGVLFAKCFGLLCAAATSMTTVRLARSSGGGPASQAAAGLFAAGATPLAAWSVQMLETPLYTLEVVALALFATRLGHWKGRTAFSLIAAAMVVTRPEGVIVAGGLCAALWILNRPRGRRQAMFIAMPVLGAVALAYIVFRMEYFGTVIGNSVVHKWNPLAIEKFLDRAVRHLREVTAFYWLQPHVAAWAVMLWPLAVRRTRRRLMPTALLLAEIVAFHLMVGGDIGSYYRFLVPAFPPAGVLLSRVGVLPNTRSGLKRLLRPIGPLLASALAVVGCIGMLRSIPLPSNFYRCPSVIRPTAHAEVAEWLKANAAPTDRVLLSEMGLIPYASGLPCFDYLGLCDRFMYERGTEFHPERYDHHRPMFVILGWIRSVDGRVAPRLPAEADLLNQPGFLRTFRPVVEAILEKQRSLMEYGYYGTREDVREIRFIVYRRVPTETQPERRAPARPGG